MGATTRWVVGSLTFTVESLRKVLVLLKVANLRKEKFLSSPVDHPKLYSSLLMGEEQYRLY